MSIPALTGPSEVSLASQSRIEFKIPSPNEISGSAQVGLIVGPTDPESPNVTGQMVAAGEYDPDAEVYVKKNDLTLYLNVNDLRQYEGKEVEIRYLISGESGEFVSDPLTVKISP